MTDDLLRLLTAAVDGELTPAEQWRVHGMLVESVEARTTLARLQSDSIRVRNLAKAKPPENLAARVMAKLPKAEPVREPIRRERSRSWTTIAIAASMFLAIGAGIFWFITRSGDGKNPGHQTAQGQPNLADVLPRDNGPLSMPPAAPLPPASNLAQVGPPVPIEVPNRYDEIPAPRPKGTDVLVAPPLLPIPPLDRWIVRVPLLVAVADLEREDAKQKLAEELGRDPAYRVDLFVKDASRGAELFQAVAKNSGINLFADAGALDRMKKKQAGSYLVYTESLTAAEIRDLFAKISADDAKNPQRNFDSLHVSAALPSDQKDLKEVLGTDPGLWKRSTATGAIPTDPKPIGSGTGDQITKALTSPAAKSGEKNAVLLSFTPAALRTNPAVSKELKEFLARRGERKASAVPVLIVIRQPSP